MPLASASLFSRTSEFLGEAAKLANADMDDLDPDLDTVVDAEGKWLSKLKLTTHSFRRFADSSARKYLETHELPRGEEKLDAQFGWNEAIAKKVMQTHYDAQTMRSRADRALLNSEM